MSSSKKTDYIRLNLWVESDKPKREDFNNDNYIIDSAIGSHFSNFVTHITDEERTKWNQGAYVGVYFGDGDLTRTIEADCPFNPRVVIVYASGKPSSVVNFSHGKKYNYHAVSTGAGDTAGVHLIPGTKSFTVTQQVSSNDYNNEFSSFNEAGTGYIYIMLK